MRLVAVMAGRLEGLAAAMPAAARCSADHLPTAEQMRAAKRRDFGFDPPAEVFSRRGDRPAPGWVVYLTHERPPHRDPDGRFDRNNLRLVLAPCVRRDRPVAAVGATGLDAQAFSARDAALTRGIFNRARSRAPRASALEDLAARARAQGCGTPLGLCPDQGMQFDRPRLPLACA